MIRSFKGKWAEMMLNDRQPPKGFSFDLAKLARRKLIQLNNAEKLGDLAVPPGNHLEALQGSLAGRHSFGSITSGGSSFAGRPQGPRTLRL